MWYCGRSLDESGLPRVPSSVRKTANSQLQGASPGLPLRCVKAEKSPGMKARLYGGNSLDISMAVIQLGMSGFDSSQGSQPFRHSAGLPKRRSNGPEFRAFPAFAFVSGPPVCRSQGGNRRKSPAPSANIPVLRRLSAETGSITTAARWALGKDYRLR